jgi:cyanoexosortase A
MQTVAQAMIGKGLAMGRIGLPSGPELWRLLALLLALHGMVLGFVTQGIETFLNVFIVWCSALVVLEGSFPLRRLQPSRLGCLAGLILISWVLWRSHLIISAEMIFNVLPVVSGLGLTLLARPWWGLGLFVPALLILALLPLIRGMIVVGPVAKLSLITAGLTQVLFMACGLPVQRFGIELSIPGGRIEVGGPCSGISMLVQLLSIAIIFMIAFPMRYRWQNALMILLAPLLGFVINGVRIALLALIVSSEYEGKRWWFDFFHVELGAQIFSAVAMLIFVFLYTKWQGRQVARLLEP